MSQYADEISLAIKDVLGVDFSKEFLTLKEIKNILADTKKVKLHYENMLKKQR